MYFVIEDSPLGLSVVGEFYTKEEAENRAFELELENDRHGCFCNYYISELVSKFSND